jgi:hypothetical protein
MVNWSLPTALNLSSCYRLALLLTAVVATGCGRDGIKVYTVPKEQPPRMTQADMPAGHPDLAASAAMPQLKWTTPDGWEEIPAGEFRVASFRITGKDGKQADVSVIPLPGGAGGDFSNVNRWRGQVGAQPVSEEELKKLAEPIEVAGQPAALYDQAGNSVRILAVIQHREGMAWFYKMTGDSQLVAREKPAFVEFLKSARFVTGEAMTARPATQFPITGGILPEGHPDISTLPTDTVPGALPNAGTPKWNTPSAWKEVPGGQFLVAKFTIAGDGNAEAAVNVSSSAGDGGGLAANVNRWRRQLGLSELSNDELAKSAKAMETTSGQGTLVEMTGMDPRSGQPTAVVGAIVLQPGQAWFYKLMGDAQTVAAQKDAFVRFVQEVKY